MLQESIIWNKFYLNKSSTTQRAALHEVSFSVFLLY